MRAPINWLPDRFAITTIYPTTPMPFGKYKGTLASDLVKDDPEYLVWFGKKVKRHELSRKIQNQIRAQKSVEL